MDDNCIFCKLANGVFETNTFYEDDDFRIIFDAAPATAGHILILPKEHFANVFEMPDELLSKAYLLAKKAATVLKEITGCEGINILQNNGEKAGQTIFHFHIHIIPRYNEKIIGWTQGEIDETLVKDIIEKASKMM